MIREVGVCLLALALPFNQQQAFGIKNEITFDLRIQTFELLPAKYGNDTTLTLSFEVDEFGVYVLSLYCTDSYDKNSIEGVDPLVRLVELIGNGNELLVWDASFILKWQDFYGKYDLPILHVVITKAHILDGVSRHFMAKFPEKDIFDVEAKDGEYRSSYNVAFTDHHGVYKGRDVVTLHNFSEKKNVTRGHYFTLQDITVDYERSYDGYNVDFYEIGLGTLSFLDYDGAYTYITAKSHEYPRERIIPVKLIFYSREGEVFSYKIRFDELYYNAKTNTMSSIKYAGYEKNERYFYIPTNNLDTICSTQFTLRFTLNLPNEFTFTYKFYLDETNSIFGSCYDSYFCQIVEHADESQVDETKVEVTY